MEWPSHFDHEKLDVYQLELKYPSSCDQPVGLNCLIVAQSSGAFDRATRLSSSKSHAEVRNQRLVVALEIQPFNLRRKI